MEVEAIDRKTRKFFTIYGVVSPRAHTSRIYLLRKEGGHGLISAVDCVTMEHLSLNLFNMFSRVKKCC